MQLLYFTGKEKLDPEKKTMKDDGDNIFNDEGTDSKLFGCDNVPVRIK